MFYSTTENKYITQGVPFTINEVQYPANWLQCTSVAEKSAIGLVEVQTVNVPADDRFYWVNSSLNNGVLTYTNTPKDLTLLKKQWKNTIRQQAHSILFPTDYMEIRNMKDATYKPEWIVWRESVRDVVSMTLVVIDGATDVSALQTAVQITWPTSPDYTGPVGSIVESIHQ